MPRGDRTGPLGAGPMTGRAAGLCAGNVAPGHANFGGGRGRGMGGGFGRGQSRGWAGPATSAPTAEQELAVLRQQAQQLRADMESVQGRIQTLEAKPEQA